MVIVGPNLFTISRRIFYALKLAQCQQEANKNGVPDTFLIMYYQLEALKCFW